MPISESVDLDLTAALRQVDDLGDALTRGLSDAVARFSSSFDNEIADLARRLDAAVGTEPVRITADTSGVTTSVTSAVDAADTEITISANADPVTPSIDGAVDAADSLITVVADAGNVTGAINAAVADADTEITVDANLGGNLLAEAAAAKAATKGIGDTAGEVTGELAVMGAAGEGSFKKLGGAVAGVVGIGLLVGQIKDATDAASDLSESGSKVGAVFRDARGEVDAFATTSAEKVGLSRQEALEAAGSFGNLLTAMGQTREEAAKLSPQIVTMGADLASFNNLDIAGADGTLAKLRAGLVGETEPLRQLGISFNAADVERKAFELGLQSANGTLTEGAKIQARWALITQQASNSQGDFARTSGGLANQLRIFQAELGNAAAEAGQSFLPLLLQAISIGRALVPLFAPIGRLLASVLAAVLPILNAVVGVAAPLLAGIADTLAGVFVALQPALAKIADIFTALLLPAISELGPAFDAVVILVGTLVDAITPLLDDALPLASFFGEVLGLLVQGAALTLGAVVEVITRLVDVLGPVIEAATPILGLAKALGLTGTEADKATRSLNQFANVNSDIIDSSEALAVSLKKDADNFGTFLVTASEFKKAGVVDELRRTGIGADDLRGDLAKLDAGLKDFVARAIEAGQVRIALNGATVTATQIRELNGTLTDYLNTSGAVVTTGDQLINSFIAQQAASEANAQTQFEAIAAARGLTDAQIAQIGVQAQAEFGVDSYTNRLIALSGSLTQADADEQAYVATLAGSAAGWVALTEAVANGTVTVDNAAAAAKILGTDTDTVTKAIGDAQKAIDTFVSNALAKFPTVTSVFDDLKKATNPVDPLSLTNNLNAATLGALTFQGNIDQIAKTFPEVAKLLQEKGPEAASAFAQTFLASSDEVKKGLEDAIVANKKSLDVIGQDLRDSIGSNVTTATDLAKQMTDGFATNLNFDEVTEQSVGDAALMLQDAKVIDPAKDAAGDAGDTIGQALILGLASGMGKNSYLIQQAARDAVKRAEEAAKEEAGVKSPSRLFAQIGEQLSAGMAVGLADEVPAVVAAAEQIVRDAAAAAAARPVTLVAQVAPEAVQGNLGANAGTSGGTAGLTIEQLIVDVTIPPGMTPAEGEEVGAAIGRGLIDQLDTEALIA